MELADSEIYGFLLVELNATLYQCLFIQKKIFSLTSNCSSKTRFRPVVTATNEVLGKLKSKVRYHIQQFLQNILMNTMNIKLQKIMLLCANETEGRTSNLVAQTSVVRKP
jgi:hypothetical protein